MFLRAKETLQLVTKVCELYRQYSVNSRMEAVYIRDEMLKLHTRLVPCEGHLRWYVFWKTRSQRRKEAGSFP